METLQTFFFGNLLIFFSVMRFQTVALLLFTTHDASLIDIKLLIFRAAQSCRQRTWESGPALPSSRQACVKGRAEQKN